MDIMGDRVNLYNEKFVRIAIDIAQRARENGNHPYGALLVDEECEILFEAENSVVTGNDTTAHAELNLVRQASASYDSAFLAKCTVYASSEPCPMCAGSIFWSNIRRVVYGLSAEKLYELVGWESEEILNLSCREVFNQGHKPVEVIGPILEDEAIRVHAGFWT
jgi:tRNA(Arg) A34 adenosine deaminase TadA